ncbi:MAG: TfoX/Sxy family protein [Proteobacteria bacterium]|nr:TfoX/Sxy family protein [Pseudomonadota bacterium]
MKWRKSPPELIELFNAVMPGPPAQGRKMFGYPAAFANGNLFMGLHQEDMLLRLPEAAREELLRMPGARIFEPMAGRKMREYVCVPAALLVDRKKLGAWVAKAFDYGKSIKPKPVKAKRAKKSA